MSAGIMGAFASVNTRTTVASSAETQKIRERSVRAYQQGASLLNEADRLGAIADLQDQLDAAERVLRQAEIQQGRAEQVVTEATEALQPIDAAYAEIEQQIADLSVIEIPDRHTRVTLEILRDDAAVAHARRNEPAAHLDRALRGLRTAQNTTKAAQDAVDVARTALSDPLSQFGIPSALPRMARTCWDVLARKRAGEKVPDEEFATAWFVAQSLISASGMDLMARAEMEASERRSRGVDGRPWMTR